jgi:hypothetical protein
VGETTWVYLRSEPGLWTVGFYDSNGTWHAESDHDSKDAAAARVHYLNGGGVQIEARYAATQAEGQEQLWFYSPYTQFRTRNGERCTMVRETPAERRGAEVGPLYFVRFEDGTIIEAWPEELHRSDVGSWGADMGGIA